MKYDFDLDLASENSLALITKKIKPNSKVLEFGPAAGRLTKYMKEVLNCSVYIVEIDEQAAEKASIYAEKAIVGDIENYTWLEEFKDIKFDYILFADVLEHLYNPKKVLKHTKLLLDESGSVIISIPNVTHASVIADLLVNKFDYRATGLLDDTHIRFFTHQSLCEMVEQSGYFILSKDAVYKNVYESELGNQFDILPKNTQKYLKNKEFSDVYQFVIEIKDSRLENEFTKVTKLSNPKSYYFSQLYINSGSGFSELQCLKKDIYLNSNNFEIDFDLKDFNNVVSLRFDPINSNCYIQLNSITYIGCDGKQYNVSKYSSNAAFKKEYLLLFNLDDPQIEFDIDIKQIETINFSFIILDVEFEPQHFANDLVQDNLNLIQSNESFNEQAQSTFKLLSDLENEKKQLLNTQFENLATIKESEVTIELLKQFEILAKKLQENEVDLISQKDELKQQILQLEEIINQNKIQITNLNFELEQSQLELKSINNSVMSKVKNVFRNEENR